MGIIKVRGYAERKVEIDTVKFIIKFTDTFTDISETIKEVNKNCELFLEKINGFIKVEDIHLDDDSSSTKWNDAKSKTYTREIYFTTKASPKINNIVNDIVKQNGIKCTVSAIYSISNLKKIHDELLSEAVKDAVLQANIMAEASNCRVSGVDKISYQRDEEYEDDYHYCVDYECNPIEPSSHHSDRLSNSERLRCEEVFVTFNIV